MQQPLRWSPLIRASRALLDAGWLGELLDVQVQGSISTPWDLWPWLASQPRLEVLFHCTGGEPETSGADNLAPLRVVEASYRSMQAGRSIRPHAVEEEHDATPA